MLEIDEKLSRVNTRIDRASKREKESIKAHSDECFIYDEISQLKRLAESYPELVTLIGKDADSDDDKVIADAMQEAEDNLVKPREIFLNVYTPLGDGSELHHTEAAAKACARDHCPEVAVKFREVMPEPEGYWHNIYNDLYQNESSRRTIGPPRDSKKEALESCKHKECLVDTVKIRREK